MTPQTPDTEQLLDKAGRGDDAARHSLLDRHRQRLLRMVAVHLDSRLAARVDPSDVVQEVLLKADQRLEEYLQKRPLPFYPWLRQLAKDRLIMLYRQHVRAKRRSVHREEPLALGLSNESVHELMASILAKGSGPSARLDREEVRQEVRAALERLSERDREVLVLRHLERLSTDEIAAVLGVTVGVVYTRHLRALQRLGKLLHKYSNEDRS